MDKKKKLFRLGVLGGMGPMAGIWFQKLIIDSTPAKKDQDHIQVICFTNPKIPDRTISLTQDGGKNYVKEVCKSLNVLAKSGASLVAITCNTAHAKLKEIQKNTSLPILDMIDLTVNNVASNFGSVLILATEATVREKIYQSKNDSNKINWICPDKRTQQKVSKIIYSIKAGCEKNILENIVSVIKKFDENSEAVIFACTEFSLYAEKVRKFVKIPIVDPLEVLAKEVVRLSYK
ncbi:MAG: amino acid racemase [bacterium]|nr:amino acid racemase [bacterium]